MRAQTITVVVSLILAAVGLFSGAAQAQRDPAGPAIQDLALNPIGRVVVATGSATIERASAIIVQASVSGQLGQAKVGDLVYQGDVVATGADGRLGISFTDGTSFNLSSNARMALSEFVYEPNGTSNSTLFNLTKGTFTFVAGKVAKTGDMKIDTPVATMGVRGTTPHVEISDDGTVKFSTLIEEGKSKLFRKPGKSAEQQPELRPPPRSNLNICRGC
jgi:hypothetical protein